MTLKTIQKLLKISSLVEYDSLELWFSIPVTGPRLLLINSISFSNYDYKYMCGYEMDSLELCGTGASQEEAIYDFFKKRKTT